MVVVALAVLVLSIAAGPRSCTAMAISPSSTFVGHVLAKKGRQVTYQVDEVLQDRSAPGLEPGPLTAGQQVAIRYQGGDERFVHRGDSYLVDAFGRDSGVHTAGECTKTEHGAGTVHADGSAIDTGLLTAGGIEPFASRLAGGLAAIAVGGLAFRWNHRRKHPQLTIDGQRAN